MHVSKNVFGADADAGADADHKFNLLLLLLIYQHSCFNHFFLQDSPVKMDKSSQDKKRRQLQLILKMKFIIKKYQHQRRQKLQKTIPTHMMVKLSTMFEHFYANQQKTDIMNKLWSKWMTVNSFGRIKSTSPKFALLEPDDVIKFLYMCPNLERFDCYNIHIPSSHQSMKNFCRNFYARLPNVKQFKNIDPPSLIFTQAYIHDLHIVKGGDCKQVTRYDLDYTDKLSHCPTYCYTLVRYLASNLTSIRLTFREKRKPLAKAWGNKFPCLKELAIDCADRGPLWKEYALYVIGILSGSVLEPPKRVQRNGGWRDAFTILMEGGQVNYHYELMISFLRNLTSIIAPMNVRLSRYICAASDNLTRLHQTSIRTSSLDMLPFSNSKLTHLRIDYHKWSPRCRRDFELYLEHHGYKLTHLEVNLLPTDDLILNAVPISCEHLHSLTLRFDGPLEWRKVDWPLFIALTFGTGKYRLLKQLKIKRKQIPARCVTQITEICPGCKVVDGKINYIIL